MNKNKTEIKLIFPEKKNNLSLRLLQVFHRGDDGGLAPHELERSVPALVFFPEKKKTFKNCFYSERQFDGRFFLHKHFCTQPCIATLRPVSLNLNVTLKLLSQQHNFVAPRPAKFCQPSSTLPNVIVIKISFPAT